MQGQSETLILIVRISSRYGGRHYGKEEHDFSYFMKAPVPAKFLSNIRGHVLVAWIFSANGSRMNIALWLERAGKYHPDHPAVGLGSRTIWNYREFAARAAKLAGALLNGCGLVAGDRVAISAKNSIHYLELLYGIW